MGGTFSAAWWSFLQLPALAEDHTLTYCRKSIAVICNCWRNLQENLNQLLEHSQISNTWSNTMVNERLLALRWLLLAIAFHLPVWPEMSTSICRHQSRTCGVTVTSGVEHPHWSDWWSKCCQARKAKQLGEFAPGQKCRRILFKRNWKDHENLFVL